MSPSAPGDGKPLESGAVSPVLLPWLAGLRGPCSKGKLHGAAPAEENQTRMMGKFIMMASGPLSDPGPFHPHPNTHSLVPQTGRANGRVLSRPSFLLPRVVPEEEEELVWSAWVAQLVKHPAPDFS